MSCRILILALTLFVAPVSGCAVLDFAALSHEPPLTADLLVALKSPLKRDTWQRHPRWTLRDTTVAENRWRFGQPVVGKVIDRLDESPETAARGDAYLEVLAKTDGIVGWNATILWAQRDPIAAHAMSATLEMLATLRPFYDPETGVLISRPILSKKLKQPVERQNTSDESNDAKSLAELRRHEDASKTTGKKRDSRLDAVSKKASDVITNSAQRSRARQISTSMQAAAAEAWCRGLALNADSPRTGLAPVGRYLRRFDVPTAVRAELMRSLARWIPPTAIPELAASLRDPNDESAAQKNDRLALRRAVMDACLIYAEHRRETTAPNSVSGTPDFTPEYAESTWPESILDFQDDLSAVNRETFGRWAAVAGHPQAFEILEQQFVDRDDQVRMASLLSMGTLGTDAARRRLRKRAKRGEIGVRAQAVRGLACWGQRELDRFANSEEEPIRAAVAVSLADWPSALSAAILMEYVDSPENLVQTRAVHAVENWPDHLATPVLLRAMGYGSSRTAKTAFRRLKSRQNFDERFPVAKTQPQRARAADALARRYNLPSDVFGQLATERINSQRAVGKQHGREIEQLLETLAKRDVRNTHQMTIDKLNRFSEDDVPVIEKLMLESRGRYPEALFTEVLAAKSERYAALADVYHDDPLVQRRGAHRLAQLGMLRPLGKLVVRRLVARLRDRRDRVLWQAALRAVMPDDTDETVQLAIEAALHPVAEVRKLACRFLGEHPQPRYVDRLLKLMNDRDDRNVQLAAIRAAGAWRSPLLISGRKTVPGRRGSKNGQSPRIERHDLLGLEDMLTSSDALIRRTAAISLAKMGDELGYRELIRMSYVPGDDIRLEAFEMMGESLQRRFVRVLIDRGWTEQVPKNQKAILQSLSEIVTEAERPVGLSAARGYHARIGLWLKQQQRTSSE